MKYWTSDQPTTKPNAMATAPADASIGIVHTPFRCSRTQALPIAIVSAPEMARPKP